MVRTAAVTMLLALAIPFVPSPATPRTLAAEPLTEAAYREAAGRWHTAWRERPSLIRRDEDSCIAAWQGGDRVRSLVRETTPPERFAAYHGALLACVESALAVSDECLLKPRGGPKWHPYLQASQAKCRAIAGIVRSGRLDLPATW